MVTMMGERGIAMAHTTILRWVQHYSPEVEKRWKRYARSVGGAWRMDETYVRVRGEWMYLYRAVDKIGKTVDFFLSRNRDVNAAKAFLRKAMRQQRTPVKITGSHLLQTKQPWLVARVLSVLALLPVAGFCRNGHTPGAPQSFTATARAIGATRSIFGQKSPSASVGKSQNLKMASLEAHPRTNKVFLF